MYAQVEALGAGFLGGGLAEGQQARKWKRSSRFLSKVAGLCSLSFCAWRVACFELTLHAAIPLARTQGKWESTDDSEKPAAIAIIVGVIVAQIAIGATIDAVDKIPIVSPGCCRV